MKYKYIALNPEQKTLSGTIEAKNEQDARAKLNKLALSVLSLQELGETVNTDNDYTRYNFEARDQSDKKVVGTIAAENKLDALKRLDQEYELNVLAIYPPSATAAEQKASFNEVQKLYKTLAKLQTTRDENIKKAPEFSKNRYRQKVRQKANDIINKVNNFLNNFADQLKEPELEYIKKELVHLQRIKTTENIENLERSCEKLLSYIKEKEIFIESSKNLQQQTKIHLQTQKLLSELKGIEHEKGLFKSGQPTKLKSKQSWWQQLKEAIFSTTPPSHKTNPELAQLIKQTRQARHDIWNYLKLIITTKKKQYRKQAIKAIKPLFRKWWRLHQELNQKQDQLDITIKEKVSPFERNLPLLTAGLIAIYLIVYFIFNFLTIKSFAITWPDFFYIHYTSVLMYIIIAIFLLHLAVKTRIWLTKKQLPLANLSYLVSLIIFGLIWLNL